jgi:hypothetical protein
MDRNQANHHANQGNTNTVTHKQALNNHSNQKNSISPAYKSSRDGSKAQVNKK